LSVKLALELTKEKKSSDVSHNGARAIPVY